LKKEAPRRRRIFFSQADLEFRGGQLDPPYHWLAEAIAALARLLRAAEHKLSISRRAGPQTALFVVNHRLIVSS
jgi:hypothetical protein